MSEQQNGHGLWSLRLLAVAIALTVWSIASFIPRVQARLADRVEWGLPVQLSYSIPEGSDLVVLNPAQVFDVQVRGTEEQQRQLNPDSITLRIALDSTWEAGTKDVNVRPEMLNLPEDVEAVAIEPDQLTLILDRNVERNIPIQPEFFGELAGGNTVMVGNRVEPSHARVRGPSTMLDRLTSVATAPISLDAHLFSFDVDIEIPQPSNSKIRILSPRVAHIWVELATPEDVAAAARGESGR